jgi:hypothetical protein
MSSRPTDHPVPEADGHAGKPEKPDKPDKAFVIHIDREQYKIDHSPATGAELRLLAGLGTDVDLYLEEHGDDEDRLIADDDPVELKNGQHFFSTPRNITPGRV